MLLFMSESLLNTFLKFFFDVYLFLRERQRQRQRKRVREGQRERETENPKQALSRLRAVSTEPDARLEPTNFEIMT